MSGYTGQTNARQNLQTELSMAFVPNKRNDVFISYATVNERPENWVTRFKVQFAKLLDEAFGRVGASKVWIDNNLRGSEPFDEQLVEEVQQSAVLLIVMSRGWLKSEWCKKELEIFHKACNGKLSGRVVLVHYETTDVEKWPKCLGGWSASKYIFYENQQSSEVSIPCNLSARLLQMFELREEVAACLKVAHADDSRESPFDLKSLSTSYSQGLLGWQSTLNDGTWLDRPELRTLIERIENSNSSQQFITGAPGSGKSSLLSKLAHGLKDKNAEFLAIKADQLPKSVSNVQELSRTILGGDELLVQRIMKLANDGPVVIIIDQLDALAALVDLDTGRLNAVLDFIAAVRGKNNVHLVASSRTHELNADIRLKGVAQGTADSPEEPIELSNLLREQVVDQLKKVEIDFSDWPEDFLETLEVPYRLYVFLKTTNATENLGVSDPQLFESLNSAHQVYWDVTVGKRSPQHVSFLENLATNIANTELLWQKIKSTTKSNILSDLQDDGWLTIYNEKMGFTHQTQYEYVIARKFANDAAVFIEHVLERQHGLAVRPVVRMTLMFMRDTDPSKYLRTFNALQTKCKRRHLQQLLREFLTNVQSPSETEVRWVHGYLKDPATHDSMCFLLRGKPDWFSSLRDFLPALMCRTDLNHWPIARFLQAAWEFAEDEVLELLRDQWAYQELYFEQLWVVSAAAPSIPETTNWMTWVVSNFPLGWRDRELMRVMLDKRPKDASFLLGRLLTRKLESRCSDTEVSENSLFDFQIYGSKRSLHEASNRVSSDLSERNWYKATELAHNAGYPFFLEQLWPWFVRLMAASKSFRDRRLKVFRNEVDGFRCLGKTSSSRSQLLEAIRKGIELLASTDNKAFEAFFVENSHLNSRTVQRLLALGMQHVAEARPDLVLSFFRSDTRRFFLPDCSQDESTQLVETVVMFWTDAQIAEFEQLVFDWDPYSEIDTESNEQDADCIPENRQYQAHLLSGIPYIQQSEATKQLICDHEVELAKFQTAWREKQRKNQRLQKETPVVEVGEIFSMNDEDLESLLEDHSDKLFIKEGRYSHLRGLLGQEFEELAEQNQERAIAIIDKLNPHSHSDIAGNILRGLTYSELDAEKIVEIVRNFIERGFSSQSFRDDAGYALTSVAKVLNGLPSDICEALESWLKQVKEEPTNETLDEVAPQVEEPSQANDRPILFGLGEGFGFPNSWYWIAEALKRGLCLGDQPQTKRWQAVLLEIVDRPFPQEFFEALLYSEYQFSRDRSVMAPAVYKLLSTYPELLVRDVAAFNIVHHANWLSEDQLQGLFDLQLQSKHPRAHQAAGEVAAHIWLRRGTELCGKLVNEVLDSPVKAEFPDSFKVGVAYSATDLWTEDDARERATDLMIRLCQESSERSFNVVVNHAF